MVVYPHLRKKYLALTQIKTKLHHVDSRQYNVILEKRVSDGCVSRTVIKLLALL